VLRRPAGIAAESGSTATPASQLAATTRTSSKREARVAVPSARKVRTGPTGTPSSELEMAIECQRPRFGGENEYNRVANPKNASVIWPAGTEAGRCAIKEIQA